MIIEQTLSASDFVPAKREAILISLSRPSLSYWQDAWIRLKKNKKALAALFTIIGLIFASLFGPFIWTLDPAYQDLTRVSEGPSFRTRALVINDPSEWNEIIINTIPEKPSTNVDTISPPETVTLIEQATNHNVRLKWSAVTGAAGYAVYRSEDKPESSEDVGVPLAQIEGGNHVSYQDQFDLRPGTYYYSIKTKNLDGNESKIFTSVPVQIPVTLNLSEAQKIDPKVIAGESLQLQTHPFGTDYLGRDVLARTIAGARVSLFIGFFAPLFALVLGMLIGGFAGFVGGKIDQWLMRVADFFLALPFLLFMILFRVAIGLKAGESGIFPMLVAMVVLGWETSALLIRGQILQLRNSEFVQAAKLLGAKPFYLIFRHMIPNTMGVILVSLTFAIPSAIFSEAFLSFIGMGVVPPTPSWGSMCNDGIQSFLNHPHEFFFPSFFITITVLSFNLLGDGLRDALDPRMRSTS
jgi:oligopeptide transport system permease protein